jgi:MYXO-CTERM domain-containing protein
MRTNSLYIALAACFLAGGVARADSIATDQVYTYTLDLPSISSGLEVDSNFTLYEFSWVGPLMFNAAPNTSCPTVCGPVTGGETVKDGYSFAGFDFTADLALSEAEAQVNFSDGSGDTVVFSFVEPDAFWATQGTDISFASLNEGEGASFAIGGTDPACAECTVSIEGTAATPEPRSAILLVALLGVFGLVMRRRLAKTIG